MPLLQIATWTPFWERFDRNGPIPKHAPELGHCWLYGGERNSADYGRLQINGRRVLSHRRAYELEYGPIPDGLMVLHRCDNPPCGRPTHLFLGTNVDNMADALSKGRVRIGAAGALNVRAKLSLDDVLAIRDAAAHGARYSALSRQFAISPTQIRRIVTGQHWTVVS